MEPRARETNAINRRIKIQKANPICMSRNYKVKASAFLRLERDAIFAFKNISLITKSLLI